MSIEHTDRWERVLLITACGAIREHSIPERDLGKDIIVPICKMARVWDYRQGQPEQEVEIYKRVFHYDGDFYGRSRREAIYREQI